MATTAKRASSSASTRSCSSPAARLQGAVPRPDRHQRRRGRAQARPQGHRPRTTSWLHQRLPRHDARLARRHRQLDEARRRRACRSAHATRMPFDGYLGDGRRHLGTSTSFLEDGGSGLDKPAAVIVETVQAEGGVNVAGFEWLRGLGRSAAARHAADRRRHPGRLRPHRPVLQLRAGGHRARHRLPVEVALRLRPALRAGADAPELDVWEPGEHNGTFRGHNPAFVTATAALDVLGGRLDEGLGILEASVAAASASTDADSPAATRAHSRRSQEVRRDRPPTRGARGHRPRVRAPTFTSRRFLLADDGMGFSFHDTVLYAGTETYMWYRHHLEAVYCIEGEGELEDLETAPSTRSARHLLRPRRPRAPHLRATTDLRMMCVFNPPSPAGGARRRGGLSTRRRP
jgi:L-ectoine synthase